jgi:hypothetical protein
VAVGGVDIGAQADARVRNRQLDVRHPGRDPPGGAVARADRPLGLLRQRLAVEPQPRQPWLGQRVVVVAGHEQHAPAGERAAQLLEQGAAHLERVGERQLAQLEDVAEQHDALAAGDRLDQRTPHLGLARDVSLGMAAEVEVRYDGRPHPGHGVRRAAVV